MFGCCMGEVGSPTEGSIRIRFRRLISLRSSLSYLPAFDNAHGTRLVSVSLQRLDRLVYRFKHALLFSSQQFGPLGQDLDMPGAFRDRLSVQ